MPGAEPDADFGLVTLAGLEAALPLRALREVVPCPEDLARLPARTDGLLGAMALRDLVVPVLDLGARLGAPVAPGDGHVVVVVCDDDRMLGVLAEGTREVTSIPSGVLRPVVAPDGPLLVSHTFRHPDTGAVVSVLDVAALLSLPGVPSVRGDTAADPAATAASRPAGAAERLTVMRCGDHQLALDVAHVHTTRADAWPQPSVFDSAMCDSVADFREQRVPVVDPLVLLGLGRMPSPSTGTGLVLDLGEGYVMLALSALVDVVDVPAQDVLALPGFAVRRPDLLRGIADIPGAGHCLVLDGAALHADPELQALAGLNVATDPDAAPTAPGAPPVTAARAGDERVYLTYSVGHDVATPLEHIAEIIAVPPAHTATGVAGAVRGVAVHRGTAVPVICLPTLLGMPRPATAAHGCLLLVAVDDEHVGFAIDALRAIDPLVWEPAARRPAAGVPVLDPARALHDAPRIAVGEPQRLLAELDLRALARSVHAGCA